MSDRDTLAELLIEAAIDGMGPRETAVHLAQHGVRVTRPAGHVLAHLDQTGRVHGVESDLIATTPAELAELRGMAADYGDGWTPLELHHPTTERATR